MSVYVKLLFLTVLAIQVALFSNDALDWCLWIPGFAICAVGLLFERRTYLSGGSLFWLVCLFLYVVAPASQYKDGYFRGEISVTGIHFPKDVILHTVALADSFLAVVLFVQVIMRHRRRHIEVEYINQPTSIKSGPPKHDIEHSSESHAYADSIGESIDSSEKEVVADAQQDYVLLDDEATFRNLRPMEEVSQTAPLIIEKISSPTESESRDPVAQLLQSRGLAIILLLGSTGLFALTFVLRDGFDFITSGRSYSLQGFADNPALGTFLTTSIQDLEIVLFLLGFERFFRNRSKGNLALLSVLFVFMIAFNNPFNTARFQFGAVLLMVMVFLWRGRIPGTLSYLGIVAYLYLVMPLMNYLRYGLADIRATNVAFGIDFNQLDYDCFSMFTFAVYRTGIDGFTYGNYQLSYLAFFVPRMWWPDKPIPSNNDLGQYLMQHHSGWFQNLSCPPMGDGYMDFGIAGVLVVGIAFGYLLERGDRVLDRWRQMSFLRRGLAAIGVAFIPILLRGSLGSVIGFVAAPIFAMVIVWLWARVCTGISRDKAALASNFAYP
jgi:hypothetical protein